jgi:hypothetical protein
MSDEKVEVSRGDVEALGAVMFIFILSALVIGFLSGYIVGSGI